MIEPAPDDETVLAMFPLEAAVLPGTILPLHIFEPRYRTLIQSVLATDPPEFGVVPIERGREVGGADHRADIGVVATVIEATELEDDRWAVVATIGRRIGITRWLPDDPHPVAVIHPRPDVLDSDSTEPLAQLRAAFEALVDCVTAMRPDLGRPSVQSPPEDAARLIWEIVGFAGLGTHDTRRLLDEDDVARRAVLASTLVTERTDLLGALGEGDR